jgi:hypothetical protein
MTLAIVTWTLALTIRAQSSMCRAISRWSAGRRTRVNARSAASAPSTPMG